MLIGLVLLVFILTALVHVWSRRRGKKEEVVVLFIDAPDPDNAAAAVALWRHVLKDGERGRLHIVLTGRPVDLRTSKDYQDGIPVSDQILRQGWETEVPEHAERLLEDSAQRLSNYLSHCKIPHDGYTIYHGGIAPVAPLSDVVHDWDFLFDRRDLVSGQEEDEGEIVGSEEYNALVVRFCSLGEEQRASELLSQLRRYPLVPLEELQSQLSSRDCAGIRIFLGGPATALVRLFLGKDGRARARKVKEFFGMFGSLQPGETTLLPDQFNVACDRQAAREIFCNADIFAHLDKFLVTTETCKHRSLVVSTADLEGRANPYVLRLQQLWESTHQDVPQPLFDVIPVMASLTEYKDRFEWARKKAEVWRRPGTQQEVFRFAECERGALYVSGKSVHLDRETFLQFLAHTWSS